MPFRSSTPLEASDEPLRSTDAVLVVPLPVAFLAVLVEPPPEGEHRRSQRATRWRDTRVRARREGEELGPSRRSCRARRRRGTSGRPRARAAAAARAPAAAEAEHAEDERAGDVDGRARSASRSRGVLDARPRAPRARASEPTNAPGTRLRALVDTAVLAHHRRLPEARTRSTGGTRGAGCPRGV